MPTLILSSARRSALRSLAHPLKPTVLIGHEGLTDAVLGEIDCHLNAHELIKIRVFGDDREKRAQLYELICQKLNAAPIQHIGKLFVIWRSAPAMQDDISGVVPRKDAAGPAPRLVKVAKRNPNSMRRVKPKRLLVLGNQRVTAGGLIKKSKRRQSSKKLQGE